MEAFKKRQVTILYMCLYIILRVVLHLFIVSIQLTLHLDPSMLTEAITIRWKDTQGSTKPQFASDDVPFIIIGSRVLECINGSDRHETGKTRRKVEAVLLVN